MSADEERDDLRRVVVARLLASTCACTAVVCVSVFRVTTACVQRTLALSHVRTMRARALRRLPMPYSTLLNGKRC
jgi:hypothetical protein